MPIPAIPAKTPKGIPITAITMDSKKMEFLLCTAVAPAEDNKPNCLTLSLNDIEKELYIREIEPTIISAISMAPKLYKTLL